MLRSAHPDASTFRQGRPLRFILLISVLLISIPLGLVSAARYQDKAETRLEPGASVEKEIADDESHHYIIRLNKGEYVRVAVIQKGVDAAVTLINPDGKTLASVNTPNTTQGSKYLFAIAVEDGNHRLEVRSQRRDASSAKYEIRIAELRAATKDDEIRINVRDLTNEGAALRLRATAASIRQAIPKLEEAIRLSRSISDREQEAQAIANLGAALFSLGRFRETIEQFRLALAIWQETDDLRNQAVALSYIAASHHRLGEWQKVLDHQNQALTIYQSLGDLPAEATQLNNIATFYAEMGDRNKAIEFYSRALPLSRKAGDRVQEITTLNNMGGVYHRTGDAQKAISHYSQALELCRAVKAEGLEARALDGFGKAQFAAGQYKAALDYYKRTLPLYRSTGDRSAEALGLINIGTSLFMVGDAAAALDHLNQAIRLLREVGNRQLEVISLYNLARIHKSSGNLEQARSHVEAALANIELLRARITNPDLRAQYFATVKNSYDLYINLLLESSGPEAAAEAFRASERARARSLIEILAEARVDVSKETASEADERELQRLRSGLAERRVRLIRDGLSNEETQTLSREIASLTTRYHESQARIKSSSPQYASLTQTEPLGLEEIQHQVLDQDTLLLEYALGQPQSHLWAVTTDAISHYALPKRAEIEAAARRYYKLISSADQNEAQEAAAQLSRIVLAPAAAHLGKKRIIIVADGALQYIPFAALPAPVVSDQRSGVRGQGSASSDRQSKNAQSNRSQTADRRPLIAEHEIVSLPSASTLAVLRRETAHRKPAAKSVAVLADPVFSAVDVRVRRAESVKRANASSADAVDKGRLLRSAQDAGLVADGASFPRLIGTRREARNILALAPESRSLEALDFKANHETASTAELGNYRIVHFATHGLINSQRPDQSGIVLSLVDEAGRPQDGFLQLHEIYKLKLPVDLVVLSACQTALGKDIRGEGLIGLTRGFMYAGALRVVASLWKVDDEATGELMKHFYKAMLADGLPAAAALRAAQMELLKQRRWRSPYYWAAFVLQGEWR